MDEDFILVLVIAGVIIGSVILFVWMKSRKRRRVVKTIAQVEKELALKPFFSKHPQLDSVWYAVRGDVSGLQVKIFGGKSGRNQNPGLIPGAGAVTKAIDLVYVMVIVALPSTLPFRIHIHRKPTLSAPSFGTSHPEFDRLIEVVTEDEKRALKLLNNDELRASIISFVKRSTVNIFITSSEVIIKVFKESQVLPVVNEAVKLANILGQQVYRVA
jgi:hypothetical protein